jgi:hypothetical protein
MRPLTVAIAVAKESLVRRSLTLTVLAGVLTLAFPAAALAGEDDGPKQTWVAVGGGADWGPDQEYRLEIGDGQWRVVPGSGGGVAAVETGETVRVRLLDASSCGVLISFAAEPGSRHLITVTDDGATSREVEELDAGPALEPSDQEDCLPDTATGAPVAPTSPILLLGTGLALVLLGVLSGRFARSRPIGS